MKRTIQLDDHTTLSWDGRNFMIDQEVQVTNFIYEDQTVDGVTKKVKTDKTKTTWKKEPTAFSGKLAPLIVMIANKNIKSSAVEDLDSMKMALAMFMKSFISADDLILELKNTIWSYTQDAEMLAALKWAHNAGFQEVDLSDEGINNILKLYRKAQEGDNHEEE